MKKNLYTNIVDDLKKYNEENDVFFVTNITKILNRINDTRDIVGSSFDNDDILIVLKDTYNDLIETLSKGDYNNSVPLEKTNELMRLINKYFVIMDTTVDDFKKDVFSNNCKLSELEKLVNINKNTNSISKIIYYVGIATVLISFLVGIIIATYADNLSSSITIMLIYFISGAFTGILIIGLSEIIKILHDIRKKLY